MVSAATFRYALLVILLAIIVGVIVNIIGEVRKSNALDVDAAAAREMFAGVEASIEEVFAEPAEIFDALGESLAVDEYRKLPAGATPSVALQKKLSDALHSARTTSVYVHGLYFIDRAGKIVASDSDDIGDDPTYILDSTERALLLREGEIALSRVRVVTGPQEKEVSIIYSTPIECTGCTGQPQVGALVAMIHLDEFFKNIENDPTLPDTLFVVNADGQYLFSKSNPEVLDTLVQGAPSKFPIDFPDDYANIIEFRGTHLFPSKDKSHTFFVRTLYPGLDGRVKGIPRKLNTRYMPTEQQFWVMGFYK